MTKNSVHIKIEGVDKLIKDLKKLGDAAEREIDKALFATAHKIRMDAIKEIQHGTKSGELYDSVFLTIGGKAVPVGPRKGKGLSATHKASAPGEAPATDTGKLASSIKAVLLPNQQAAISAKISTGDGKDYAFYLEYGTKNMAARPFLRPAVKNNEQLLIDRLNKAMSKVAGRA